ncbi:MAG: VWA domain-containing protein [Planctomycetota bacterium]|nr:MAG: VWA domain-containing protein [Planctomycetota bacterium]
MELSQPWWLVALAVLPVLAWLRGGRGRAPALRFSSVAAARRVARRRRSRAGAFASFLRLAALALLIGGLARPQRVQAHADVQASGVEILLAVDVSGSMQAMDFEVAGRPVDRLTAVKRVVKRFVRKRPADRIGLVAFAAKPYLVSPLTLDHDWLLERLDSLEIGMIEDGTAIGSALAAATARLRDEKAKSKVVILLTDGVNNAGEIAPETAAEAAAALGIKVYAIGAGTRGKAPMPAVDPFGRRTVVMADVEIDEATLEKVARTTGGAYFRATDTASLERIYDEIDRLEKTEHTLHRYAVRTELFPWLVWPALGLLGIEWLFVRLRLRRLP